MGQQRTVSDAINDLWTKGIKPVDETKAPLNSPALTGTPTAPTPAANDNSTKIATTAYVAQRIQNLINAAPAALDTLGEIATALKNNPNAIQEILTALGNKADKTAGTSSTLGLTKLYTGTGSNTDGTMTQKAISDELNKKLGASDEIEGTYGSTTKGITQWGLKKLLDAKAFSADPNGTIDQPTRTGIFAYGGNTGPFNGYKEVITLASSIYCIQLCVGASGVYFRSNSASNNMTGIAWKKLAIE